MEKPDPNKLFTEALRTGKVKIQPPYPGYVGRAALNYDVRLSDFIEYFNAATRENLPENMKRYLMVAEEGVQDLNEYLDNMLGTPILEFHIPRNEKDALTTPRLDGFNVDNGVKVKLLRGYGIRYDYKGLAYFDTIAVPFNVSYRHNIKRVLARAYSIENSGGGSDLSIFRIPVILNTNNADCPQFHKFADLSFYVLLNQLEPFTTNHLCQRLNNHGKKLSQEDLEREVNEVLTEEIKIGKIIICSWLEKRGINRDLVNEWASSINDKDEIEAGLRRVRTKGIERVVDFYCSQKWRLEKLLQPN